MREEEVGVLVGKCTGAILDTPSSCDVMHEKTEAVDVLVTALPSPKRQLSQRERPGEV